MDEPSASAEDGIDEGSLAADGIEMLKHRLQRKIQELRSNRHTAKGASKASSTDGTSNQRKYFQPFCVRVDLVLKLRNPGVSNPAKSKQPSKPEDIARAVSGEVISEIMSATGNDAVSVASGDDEEVVVDEGDVEFSGLVSGSGRGEGTLATQNKPGSKMKRLRRMQEEAQKKRQRIEELKSQGAKGADRCISSFAFDNLR